jgi:hypothetical protein
VPRGCVGAAVDLRPPRVWPVCQAVAAGSLQTDHRSRRALGFRLVPWGSQLGDFRSDPIGDLALRRGSLYGALPVKSCYGISPGVAVRRFDRLQLLDVDFRDRLELVCQL